LGQNVAEPLDFSIEAEYSFLLGVSNTKMVAVASQRAVEALSIFRAAVPTTFFENLRKASGLRAEGGVYTTETTTWLIIQQRLDGKATLSTAVQQVGQGRPQQLLPNHKRLEEETLSSNTGGYSRARSRLKKEVAEQVSDKIFNYLMADAQEALPGLGRQAFLLDGSSLDLPATPKLLEAYPPPTNQHGTAHWPIVRMVVAHDVVSGIGMRPHWGPMYGDKAVSEQQLAADAIGQLPPGSVVVGDRNFGVFSTAYDADQRSYPVVVRLTDSRARSLLKGKLPPQLDRKIDWKPSRWDRKSHPDLPADACVQGRLIACQVTTPKGQTIPLFLFTTLDMPLQKIVQLYGYRWNIETDLRSLKQTVHMHSLTARSVEMVAKELVLGVSAYNLVRGTMYVAARVAGIDARQLSFSRVQDVVNAALPNLMAADSEEEYQRLLDRLLRRAGQCRLPRRPQRPTYPRAVWQRAATYPKRKT